ncbi:MAG: hypothetical protein Q9170_001689 [Blastenia crenularia]
MVTPQPSIIRKIWSSRPLRPPRLRGYLLGQRPFTQNSQLLSVSRTNPRPELPYLFIPSAARFPQVSSHGQFRNQLSRFLNTEGKQRFKSEAKQILKYILIVNVGLISFGFLMSLVNIEVNERKYKTPSEWSFRSRNIYRAARKFEEPNHSKSGVIDWPDIDNNYTSLLSRLEDPDLDGQDLPLPPDDQDRVWVFGLRKLGFTRKGLDVSMKSEEWRRSYYATIMGAARAAEHLDEWVSDRTRGMSCPKEYMIGPSNPHPRPVPYGALAAPLEENCDPASEPPQTFYMKILTSTGFTTGQRLDAALAYADYLDWKGHHEHAEDMHDWGLDIAMGGLPMGANNVVDTRTGVINSDATYVSSNLLKATGALAVHQAQMNNLSGALPVFLSILRARKQLSVPHVPDPPPEEPTTAVKIWSCVKWLLVSPPYPLPPPSGDEAPIRSPKAVCEESAIMAHVGEILFASSQDDMKPPSDPKKSRGTSQKQEAGLSWTRDAVDISELTLASMSLDNLDERQVCADCLKSGMENWSTMVRKIIKGQQEATSRTETAKNRSEAWFWGGPKLETTQQDKGRWQRELSLVFERTSNVEQLLHREENLRKAESASIIPTIMLFN